MIKKANKLKVSLHPANHEHWVDLLLGALSVDLPAHRDNFTFHAKYSFASFEVELHERPMLVVSTVTSFEHNHALCGVKPDTPKVVI